MTTILQEHLTVRIESGSFPGDLTRVYRLTGKEVISQPFWFEVGIAVKGTEGVDIAEVTGSDIDIVFERAGAEIRRVHGMIAEVHDLLARLHEYRAYRLRVTPRAVRLTLVETSEVTMNQTVPDIIKNKLQLVGLSGSDVEMRLLASYPPREFVAQYQETDLAFIGRLTEHLGISYFFHNQSGQDTIVFTDHAGGFEPLPEAVRYNEVGEGPHVFELEARARVIPSMFVVRDYNYRQPLLDLTAEQPAPTGYAGGVIEFGGHYKTPAEGKALAQVRAEEQQSTQLVYEGKSGVPAIGAGVKFTMEEHPYLGSAELLAVEVEHRAYMPGVIPDPAERKQHYINIFRAVPAEQTYRPPRITKKPRITGIVTGIVDTGPGGSTEYAQIDDQGRYMVRLLFDTAATGGMVSRPVRMAQNHAGANYGTHFPLKPGVEVIIAFVNGDPDRPIIVGAVPNPLTPSPVDVANRTTHRIKTKAGILIDLVDE